MKELLNWPPLWSRGQSSWLQIQRSGFDSRRNQFFWEVVGLERGPLSLVSTIQELLERKSSDSGLRNRDYGRRDPLWWPRNILYPQKLALTSSTSSGHHHKGGVVGLRNQATEFSFIVSQSATSSCMGGASRGGKQVCTTIHRLSFSSELVAKLEISR
jgi:hypothetical protein